MFNSRITTLPTIVIPIVVIFFSGTSNVLALNICAITCSTSYSSTNNIDFGNFDPYAYTNIIMPVTLSINCIGNDLPDICLLDTDLSYTYKFDGGKANNVTARHMGISDSCPIYKICVDSSCSKQYGDASGGTVQVSNNINFVPAAGNTDTYTIYFLVPVQAALATGTYLDSIIGTLTYKY